MALTHLIDLRYVRRDEQNPERYIYRPDEHNYPPVLKRQLSMPTYGSGSRGTTGSSSFGGTTIGSIGSGSSASRDDASGDPSTHPPLLQRAVSEPTGRATDGLDFVTTRGGAGLPIGSADSANSLAILR